MGALDSLPKFADGCRRLAAKRATEALRFARDLGEIMTTPCL